MAGHGGINGPGHRAQPVYIGKIRYRGEVLDGAYEPLIDEDLWHRVQDVMDKRPSKGRGRPPKAHHLFRGGLLRCECGEAMVPRTADWECYYCNGRGKRGKDFCDMPHIRRTDIDAAV